MTILEERIELALKKIGVSWYPFFMRDGQAVFPAVIQTPACIQDTNDKWIYMSNGNIKRSINFYMFDKRKKELSQEAIRDIIVKQNAITQLILQFLKEMSETEFRVELIGQPYKSHDNMPILDVGQDFTLTIEYNPCQI